MAPGPLGRLARHLIFFSNKFIGKTKSGCMGPHIDNAGFAAIDTPVPSQRLVEEGAYPVRTADGWVVPVDRFEPVLKAYSARTTFLSGTEPPRGRSIFLSDFLTNEKSYPDVLESIEGLGGIYVGTTRALSFTFPAVAGASHAFVVDFDAAVPFGFTPVWGALLAMAPTRAHFVSLLLGAPIGPYDAQNLSRERGEELIFRVWSRIPDDEFSAAVHRALMYVAVNPSYSRSRSLVENTLDKILKYSSTPQLLNVLAEMDAGGRGGLLSSEEAYQRERRFFIDGRMTGFVANFAGSEMAALSGAIIALGEKVGLVYISNIENWLWDDVINRNAFSTLQEFYRNISTLGRLGGPDTQIISSLQMFPSISPLDSFLLRSSPGIFLSEQEAFQLYKLREILIKAARHEGNDGRSPRNLIDFVSRELVAVKSSKENGGQSVRHFLLALPADEFKWMFRSILDVMGDEPLEWGRFDEAMMRKNKIWREMSQAMRYTFLIYLTDLGVVSPPYPVVRENQELMLRGHGAQAGAQESTVTGLAETGETASARALFIPRRAGQGDVHANVRRRAVAQSLLRRIPAAQRTYVRTPAIAGNLRIIAR